MNVVYRPHRMGGSIYESVKLQKNFNTLEDMLKYVVDASEGNFGLEDVYIGYAWYDDRIGMEVFFVLISRYGSTEYKYPQCQGYCSFLPSETLLQKIKKRFNRMTKFYVKEKENAGD